MCSIGRFSELLVTSACLALHLKSSLEDDPLRTVVSGVFVGYTAVLAILSLSDCCCDRQMNKPTDIVFSLISGAVFVVIGVLIANDWHGGFNDLFGTQKFEFAQAKAILAVIDGILFLLDGLFTLLC